MILYGTSLTNAFPKIVVPETYALNALKFEMTTNVMTYARTILCQFEGQISTSYLYQNQIRLLLRKKTDRSGGICSLKKLKIVYGFAFVLCNRLELEQQ